MNRILTIYKKFQKIIDYVFFGALTTGVNIGVFYLFETILSTSYMIANAIAIVLAILFAYVTNKKFVFKSKTSSIKETALEFFHFVSFRILSGIFDMVSMYIFIDGLGIGTNISKIVTQFVVLVLNYLFSRFIVFKEKK